jgi:hypothetical protein
MFISKLSRYFTFLGAETSLSFPSNFVINYYQKNNLIDLSSLVKSATLKLAKLTFQALNFTGLANVHSTDLERQKLSQVEII